ALEPRRVDADRQALRQRRDLLDRLLEEFLHMREDDYAPVPELHGVAADRRDDRRLAPAGGNDNARIVVARPQVLVHRVDGLALVGAQLHHAASVISTVTPPSGTTSPRS